MIQPVNALTPKVSFKGQYSEFKNPVNKRTEKRLAILNAGGVSVAMGAVTTAIARSYTSSWKHASWFGLGAAAVTMLFVSEINDTNPFILLNYEGKLDDVSTLVHESGHSIHTYLSCKNNTYANSSYQIFVAEVASTVNEMLLRLYLIDN